MKVELDVKLYISHVTCKNLEKYKLENQVTAFPSYNESLESTDCELVLSCDACGDKIEVKR